MEFWAGSVCGTDLPCSSGLQSTVAPRHGAPGYSLHEVVGTVASTFAEEVAGSGLPDVDEIRSLIGDLL